MTTIIHISDTHFGTEVTPVVEALKNTVDTLKPDIIILSGDITQRATSTQFKNAGDFMNDLPAKTKLVIPGNHDIPLFNIKRLLMPYANYKNAFGKREHIWSNGEIGILCYDATSPLRHTRGKLTNNAVLANIKALKDKPPIIIACAHQPLVTALATDAHETLINRDQIAKLWAENNIDIALSGHVHMPLLTTTHTHFPDLPRHFILAGAGTAISHRIRSGAPNSFNVIITSSNDLINITHYSFETKLNCFVSMHPMSFNRTDKGWVSVN